MSDLRIHLLGNVRLYHGTSGYETKMPRNAKALLAYLILQRCRSHPREVLASLFWGDYSEDNARSSLRTSLWRLRQILEPEGVTRGRYLLTNSSGEVGFNRESDYWLDVEAFESQARQVLSTPMDDMRSANIQDLEQATQIYNGELLEGFYLDYFLRERERLRALYLDGLILLMRFYKNQRAFDQSLAYGQKILDQEPLREEIHREMMRLYMESGERALAMRQYKVCKKIMEEELGILPMEETRALHAQIASVGENGKWHEGLSREPLNIQQSLESLNKAIECLDATREQLNRAVRFMRRSVTSSENSV